MKNIDVYSRKQAIQDGLLVDVSEMAMEVGIRIPVAVTKRLWDDFIVPAPKSIGQSVEGRLWDVLWLLLQEIRRGAMKMVSLPSTFGYLCYFAMGDTLKPIALKAVLDEGDDMQATITIMLAEED